MKIRTYHLCLLQHVAWPTKFQGNLFQTLGLLGRSSATRELGKQDFIITYRKPPSLKDMLVKAKIAQPRTTTNRGCKRPNTCKYCKHISQSLRIKNLNNNKSYNTITKGTCQSNNLIYYLECNWYHIKYVGQTKNRIIDRFQGHIFDIKHNNNTTMSRHFYSHNDIWIPK